MVSGKEAVGLEGSRSFPEGSKVIRLFRRALRIMAEGEEEGIKGFLSRWMEFMVRLRIIPLASVQRMGWGKRFLWRQLSWYRTETIGLWVHKSKTWHFCYSVSHIRIERQLDTKLLFFSWRLDWIPRLCRNKPQSPLFTIMPLSLCFNTTPSCPPPLRHPFPPRPSCLGPAV